MWLFVCRELNEKACQVLSILLDGVKGVRVFETYNEQLLYGLKHPSCEVKALCAYQVNARWRRLGVSSLRIGL